MPEGIPDRYDTETDVVVVGYGAAGAAAAITASDLGASVLLLEKMPVAGGNSRLGGANIIIPRDTRFADYLERLSFKTTEREIIDVFVAEALKHEEWIKQMGGELEIWKLEQMGVPYMMKDDRISFPGVPGAENTARYHLKGNKPELYSGQRLWELVSGNVERRNIEVMLRTPAKELIRNHAGEVVGVGAESAGRKLAIKARKGVILTCGGYENNDALKWDFLPLKGVKFIGNPGNTGDGIRMVQRIGGDIWHMTRMACYIGYQAPGYEAAFSIFFFGLGFIFVDRYGKRFVDETNIDAHEYNVSLSYFDREHVEFPRIPFWAVFDEDIIRHGPMNLGRSGSNKDYYKWSLDNKEEIKKGWILKAKNARELAKVTSMDEATIENTITRFNEYSRAGKDPEFGRAKINLKAIESPFYAIRLWPALLNTQGGPRRDKEARVLDVDGNPIPRLYAAGELGSIWGFLYQTACNISECLAFGRIAGRNAAGNPPLG
ncbi:MAG: FAD-binding protein [Chloroflexi bacterium]|nr:FAD-binding protein [Chloroflexota bacterium]